MPIKMKPIEENEYRSAIEGCLANADELVQAAKAISNPPALARISFHLSALALEELAKAHLLRLVRFGHRDGREVPPVIQKALDDRGHVKRLFWAIWAQTLGREIVTARQIEQVQGLAHHIHRTRLRGLYVDVTDDGVSLPSEAVEPQLAESLRGMAESLLEHERGYSFDGRSMTHDERALQVWFLGSDDDPELQKLIFSAESMRKLADFGAPAKWIAWLKATWEEHERSSREFLERELNRQPVTQEPATERPQQDLPDKWKLRIRLYTNSHSVRQKPLNEWNAGVTWIRLDATDKAGELLAEFTAPAALPLAQLYHRGWGISRRFATSLNIGSMGFFWWYVPQHVDRFYDKLVDSETGREVQMFRDPRLVFEWPRAVLDPAALSRTMLAMSMMPEFEREHKRVPLEGYITGLTWLSKSDIHMQFEPHAFGCFYGAFRSATQDWLTWEEPHHSKDRVLSVLRRIAPASTDYDRYIAAGENFSESRRLSAMTLKDAVVMKICCDLLFLEVFRERERATNENSA